MNGSDATRSTMKVTVLRTSGAEEKHFDVPRGSLLDIYRLIGCELVDVVNLRDGRMMLVDDEGLLAQKPTNRKATEIYRALTGSHDGLIVGDVALVEDEDFS